MGQLSREEIEARTGKRVIFARNVVLLDASPLGGYVNLSWISWSVAVRNRTPTSVSPCQPSSAITSWTSLSVEVQNRNQFGRMKYSSRLRVRREFKWCGEALSSDRKLKTSDYRWGEPARGLKPVLSSVCCYKYDIKSRITAQPRENVQRICAQKVHFPE